jgi:hypothetical protein
MRDEYLVTEGVHSTVWKRENGRLDGLGHVALFDWDGHVSADDVAGFDGLDGPTFLWESSPGKLHGWNVVVRRFPSAAETLETFRDDTKHRRVGVDRGWWRLRVGEKRPVEDDVYKQSPEFLGLYDDEVGGFVSDPHLELARVCGVPESIVAEVRDTYEPVGDGTKIVSYATMTDMEKCVRRRME